MRVRAFGKYILIFALINSFLLNGAVPEITYKRLNFKNGSILVGSGILAGFFIHYLYGKAIKSRSEKAKNKTDNVLLVDEPKATKSDGCQINRAQSVVASAGDELSDSVVIMDSSGGEQTSAVQNLQDSLTSSQVLPKPERVAKAAASSSYSSHFASSVMQNSSKSLGISAESKIADSPHFRAGEAMILLFSEAAERATEYHIVKDLGPDVRAANAEERKQYEEARIRKANLQRSNIEKRKSLYELSKDPALNLPQLISEATTNLFLEPKTDNDFMNDIFLDHLIQFCDETSNEDLKQLLLSSKLLRDSAYETQQQLLKKLMSCAKKNFEPEAAVSKTDTNVSQDLEEKLGHLRKFVTDATKRHEEKAKRHVSPRRDVSSSGDAVALYNRGDLKPDEK